MTKLKGVWKKV